MTTIITLNVNRVKVVQRKTPAAVVDIYGASRAIRYSAEYPTLAFQDVQAAKAYAEALMPWREFHWITTTQFGTSADIDDRGINFFFHIKTTTYPDADINNLIPFPTEFTLME